MLWQHEDSYQYFTMYVDNMEVIENYYNSTIRAVGFDSLSLEVERLNCCSDSHEESRTSYEPDLSSGLRPTPAHS